MPDATVSRSSMCFSIHQCAKSNSSQDGTSPWASLMNMSFVLPPPHAQSTEVKLKYYL